MLGGAIKRPTSTDAVWVQHTEEVEVKANGEVPLPKDHLTGVTYNAITASATHPIRIINLTTGVRTQLVTGTYSDLSTIKFVNPAMQGNSDGVAAVVGDKLRIFWDEEVKSATATDAAVEVTISSSTFPGTLTQVA